MANYPSKPWNNNLEAEIYPGKTFRFNADLGFWSEVSTAAASSYDSESFEIRYDGDRNVLKASINERDSDWVASIVSELSGDYGNF